MTDRSAAAALLEKFGGNIEEAAQALVSEVEAGPRAMKENTHMKRKTHFTEIGPDPKHPPVLRNVHRLYKFYEDGDKVDVYYYVDGRTTHNTWTYHLDSEGATLTLKLPKTGMGVLYYLGLMQEEINRIRGTDSEVFQYFVDRGVVLPTQNTYRVQVKPGRLSESQRSELERKNSAVFNFWVKGETGAARVKEFFDGFNISEEDIQGQNFSGGYLDRLYEKLQRLNDIAEFAAGSPYELTDLDLTEARQQRIIDAEIIDTRRLLREKKTELKGLHGEDDAQDYYKVHVSHSDTMALLFEETENAGYGVIQYMEERYNRPFTHYHVVKLDVPLDNDILQKMNGEFIEMSDDADAAIASFEFKMRSMEQVEEFKFALENAFCRDVVLNLDDLFNRIGESKGWKYNFKTQFSLGSLSSPWDNLPKHLYRLTIQKTIGYSRERPVFETLETTDGEEEGPFAFRIVVPYNMAILALRQIRYTILVSDSEPVASAKPAQKNQVDKYNSRKAIPAAIPPKPAIPVPAKIPVVSKSRKREWRF
jgi:hypothetical protein